MSPTPPFFPPWYFWVVIFGIVAVVVSGLVTMIVCVVRANCQQRIRERELAARLIEMLVREQGLAPVEIERLIQAYWHKGSFWWRLAADQVKLKASKTAVPYGFSKR
jgi:hypothetical protein